VTQGRPGKLAIALLLMTAHSATGAKASARAGFSPPEREPGRRAASASGGRAFHLSLKAIVVLLFLNI